MDLVIAKAIVSISLFVGTFIMTMLPIKIISVVEHTMDPSRRRMYMRTISWLNCFGGGVFLAACLLDLFPEVRDQLSDTFDEMQIVTSFPVAEFVMIFGFLLAFIMEQIVLSCQDIRNSALRLGERRPLLDDDVHSSYRSNIEVAAEDNTALLINQSTTSRVSNRSIEAHSVHSIEFEPHSTLRSMVLLMALSLHSIFEGLAIGLQPTLNELAQILAAVAIHKGVIAFSLGLNLVQSNLRLKSTVMLNILFSVTTPTGILIGMAIVGLSHSVETNLVTGILQGIACGTFLFVTFFEVLPHEMNGKGGRLPKVLAIIIGCAAVCGALFLDPSIERPSCYRGAQPAHHH